MDGAQVRLLVLNILGSNTTCYNEKICNDLISKDLSMVRGLSKSI